MFTDLCQTWVAEGVLEEGFAAFKGLGHIHPFFSSVINQNTSLANKFTYYVLNKCVDLLFLLIIYLRLNIWFRPQLFY
jgi:hypothetical protein